MVLSSVTTLERQLHPDSGSRSPSVIDSTFNGGQPACNQVWPDGPLQIGEVPEYGGGSIRK